MHFTPLGNKIYSCAKYFILPAQQDRCSENSLQTLKKKFQLAMKMFGCFQMSVKKKA
jgi:hypothetical protein